MVQLFGARMPIMRWRTALCIVVLGAATSAINYGCSGFRAVIRDVLHWRVSACCAVSQVLTCRVSREASAKKHSRFHRFLVPSISAWPRSKTCLPDLARSFFVMSETLTIGFVNEPFLFSNQRAIKYVRHSVRMRHSRGRFLVNENSKPSGR